MKKLLAFAAMMLVLVLAACGNDQPEEKEAALFKESMAIPFQIVKYEEKIAPVYGNLVPYIAYAKTEGQLAELSERFQIGEVDIDMDKEMAVFVAANSNSCGYVINTVFDNETKLSVQATTSKADSCDDDPVPHTFVLKVDKADFTKVQLYEGNVLKSTMDIKE